MSKSGVSSPAVGEDKPKKKGPRLHNCLICSIPLSPYVWKRYRRVSLKLPLTPVQQLNLLRSFGVRADLEEGVEEDDLNVMGLSCCSSCSNCVTQLTEVECQMSEFEKRSEELVAILKSKMKLTVVVLGAKLADADQGQGHSGQGQSGPSQESTNQPKSPKMSVHHRKQDLSSSFEDPETLVQNLCNTKPVKTVDFFVIAGGHSAPVYDSNQQLVGVLTCMKDIANLSFAAVESQLIEILPSAEENQDTNGYAEQLPAQTQATTTTGYFAAVSDEKSEVGRDEEITSTGITKENLDNGVSSVLPISVVKTRKENNKQEQDKVEQTSGMESKRSLGKRKAAEERQVCEVKRQRLTPPPPPFMDIPSFPSTCPCIPLATMTCVQVKIGSFCCDLPNLKEEMDVVFSKKGIMFTLPPTPSQNRLQSLPVFIPMEDVLFIEEYSSGHYPGVKYFLDAPRPTAFKEEENPWPPAVVFLTTTQRYATLLRELMGFSQDPECEDFHYNPEHGGPEEKRIIFTASKPIRGDLQKVCPRGTADRISFDTARKLMTDFP